MLEESQARLGVNTPPEIILEIEDIQYQISSLEDQLAHLDQSDAPSTPDDTRPQPRLTQTLPEPVADFVGRSRQINYLTKELGRTAKHGIVVSICGMAGVGKTQLAYAVAQRLTQQFHDGQFTVKLRGTSGEPLTAMQGLQQILRTIAPEITLPDDLSELQDEVSHGCW